MNTQNTNFFKQLGQEQLNNLTKEVKETVAIGININNKNVFGAVDYWKMQRNRRTRIVRRHLVA
jgi:protein-arginine kinase